MAETLLFELTLEAEAEVVRACCGEAHEFGECPNADQNKEG
jgi:hypothetical protein